MRAPVGHDPVAALRGIAPAAVADDRVVWDAGRDRKLIYFLDKAIVGTERVDAVGDVLELPFRVVVLGDRDNFIAHVSEQSRRFDQSSDRSANPARGEP